MLGTAVLTILFLAQLSAADAQAQPSMPDTSAAAAATETLKERLSDKASDEQRVDNCRVPAGQRGTKPRPDCRAGDPAATSRTTGADRRPPS
ncbi:MAG TPA: hypothetical protein VF502_11345 [Stellaceae bacterium]